MLHREIPGDSGAFRVKLFALEQFYRLRSQFHRIPPSAFEPRTAGSTMREPRGIVRVSRHRGKSLDFIQQFVAAFPEQRPADVCFECRFKPDGGILWNW